MGRRRGAVRLAALTAVLLTSILAQALPAAAIAPGDDAFEATWARTDQPVAGGAASRTWMWGPSGFTSAMYEPYEESPNGRRVVQYFDKTRMEITNPYGDSHSIWYVTNGLLAKELVSGQLQLGNNSFDTRAPAEVNVAGDADDPTGPTYATFNQVLAVPLGLPDAVITSRIDRAAVVTDDPSLAAYNVTAQQYVAETNHRVASVFWSFMNSQATVWDAASNAYRSDALFQNPFFATGYPITEAYWANVKVGGSSHDVLIQVFERRVLTYTPGNAPEWQVEAGNVGQHYYIWRYNTPIPNEPAAVDFVGDYWGVGVSPMMEWPWDNSGTAHFTIGNNSPYPMLVKLEGPVSQFLTIDSCAFCSVYPTHAAFTGCLDDIPVKEVDLPAGNYRVQVSWLSGNVIPAGGPWTVVPNAYYGVCWAVISDMSGSPH